MPSNILNQSHTIDWLAELPDHAKHLKASLRFELRFCVHADGYGFIQHLNQESHTGAKEQPVNNPEEAIDLLRAVWEQAAILKAQGTAHENSGPKPTRSRQ